MYPRYETPSKKRKIANARIDQDIKFLVNMNNLRRLGKELIKAKQRIKNAPEGRIYTNQKGNIFRTLWAHG